MTHRRRKKRNVLFSSGGFSLLRDEGFFSSLEVLFIEA
jgi:hypothetical protein